MKKAVVMNPETPSSLDLDGGVSEQTLRWLDLDMVSDELTVEFEPQFSVALVQKNSSHRKGVWCNEFLQFSQLTIGCLRKEMNLPLPLNCNRCEPLLRTGFLEIKIKYRKNV